MSEKNDLWVFGYGSLMWRPGFDAVETVRARVAGLHRAPCIFSWEHRGSRDRPGIVLGLDRGGTCIGMAFRVDANKRETVLAYLRERELVTNVYLETMRPVRLDDGRTVNAVTYIADRNHEQYAGRLTLEKLVAQISGAVGNSGPNEAYILDTLDKMKSMGIRDALLENVARSLVKT